MKKALITTAIVSALTLTGCGGSNDTSEAADNAPAETKNSKPTPEETTETEGDGDEEGMSDDETITVGQEFRVNSFDEDDTIYHWDIKVTGIETTDVLKNADDNEDYYSGDDVDAPEKIDATPDDGNEFVHITYEQKNTSGAPSSLDLNAELVFSDGETFAALGDDGDYYTPNLTEQHDQPAGETQNNNTTAEGDWVFEVPKGSDVDAVIVNEYAANADEEFWVFLK